jgi:glucose-6-phosphate isomerase
MLKMIGHIAAMTMTSSNLLTRLKTLSRRSPPCAEELHKRLNDASAQSAFIHQLDDMVVDFSRQSLRDDDLAALIDWGQTILPQRDALLEGKLMNKNESSLVLHTQLRDLSHPAAQENIAAMAKATQRILALGIEDVVVIGIGGSYLGSAMVAAGLTPFHQGPELHFVANLDPSHLDDTLMTLNPLTTAVITISKSFTTKEALINMAAAQVWLEGGGLASQDRIFAVTACPMAAEKIGIAAENILTMDAGVGGRFSLWSAVGLPVMVALGEEMFTALIAGAEQMDKHFATAPVAENMPILGALIQIWNRAFLGYSGAAIIPYDQRLAKLPTWLQQLVMESNGKSVTADGTDAGLATAPIIFGDVGSNAQHSFFQMIHQSNDVTPVDFLAPLMPISMTEMAEDDSQTSSVMARHRDLIAQMLAQADCLALGQLSVGGSSTGFSGGRPSSLITWSSTTPFALGRVLAYYEHLTVVSGWLVQINSFDQPGVELGKTIAKGYTGYMNKDHRQKADNHQKADGNDNIPANSKKYLDQIS